MPKKELNTLSINILNTNMNFFFTKFCLIRIKQIEWLFRLPDRETNYFVRAGSNKLYQGGSLHKLTKIYMYNNTMFQYWFSSILYHDIALFEVRPRFRFSSTVRAVRLPTEFSKPPQQLCVCGWGYTSIQSNVSVYLVPPIVDAYQFRFIGWYSLNSQLWISNFFSNLNFPIQEKNDRIFNFRIFDFPSLFEFLDKLLIFGNFSLLGEN